MLEKFPLLLLCSLKTSGESFLKNKLFPLLKLICFAKKQHFQNSNAALFQFTQALHTFLLKLRTCAEGDVGWVRTKLEPAFHRLQIFKDAFTVETGRWRQGHREHCVRLPGFRGPPPKATLLTRGKNCGISLERRERRCFSPAAEKG